jgi:arylsulfatase A-like enzyme
MRDGDWKLIYFYAAARWELYDLASDLGERHDLAKDRPEVLKRLARRLVDLLEKRGAQYPIDKASGEEAAPRLP